MNTFSKPSPCRTFPAIWTGSAFTAITWQVVESLNFTVGLSYDWLHYPLNIDTSPITDAEDETARLSPKAGVIWTPTTETHVRAAYTRSLG